jgi:hypothetical protein
LKFADNNNENSHKGRHLAIEKAASNGDNPLPFNLSNGGPVGMLKAPYIS